MPPLPPHKLLKRYYTNDAERPRVVREIFDSGARSYELVCRVMSLGTGAMYRANALREAGLQPGMRILDVATGTGLMLRAARGIVGSTGDVIGLDPSCGMLSECRKTTRDPLIQALGESLPLRTATFDMVSMGYGLRHVGDLRSLFSEYGRVLKPGGTLLLLELSQPHSSAGRWLARVYLRTLVPSMARITTRSAAAGRMMDYFWETIENCVPPDSILAALREAGFSDAKRKVSGGILSEYTGTRS